MDTVLIDKLFSEFYWMFIFANYVGILIPIIILRIKRFRTSRNITIAAVIDVAALWVNRYIIVVPTLETPFLPIQDSRPDWLNYSPTWVELSLTMAGIAVFVMFYMVITKLVPIISISEMTEEDEEKDSILN